MPAKYVAVIESVGLDFFLVLLFFFIGMAIYDLIKNGNVPLIGKIWIWGVLCLGCSGFLIKGIMRLFW